MKGAGGCPASWGGGGREGRDSMTAYGDRLIVFLWLWFFLEANGFLLRAMDEVLQHVGSCHLPTSFVSRPS